MCGIVGYIGQGQDAQQVILDALRRLEYRGYDSAGVAIFERGSISIRRAVGKLGNLEAALRDRPISGRDRRRPHALGHARQALGAQRASAQGRLGRGGAQRHHGELPRAARRARGERTHDRVRHRHRADRAPDRRRGCARAAISSPRCARRARAWSAPTRSACSPRPTRSTSWWRSTAAARSCSGSARSRTTSRATSRRSCPTRAQMLFLEDGEFAVVSEDAVQVLDRDGRPIDREPRAIQWDPVSAEKGGYDRFMQKEIFEQPRAITDTIGTRVLEAEGDLDLERDRPLAEPRGGDRSHRARRVRHRLARLPRRQVHDRAARGHPVRRRSRERVPLPQADPRRRACS